MRIWYASEHAFYRMLLLISGVTLAFMLLFTITDVIMRAFGKPIVGDFEIISFLGAVVIGFALPYTSLYRGHVIVDFFIELLPKRARDCVEIATRITGIALFLWISWNFILMSFDLKATHTVTPVFRLPYYPISFGLAFCCLVQCFAFFSQIMRIIGGRNG